MSNNNALNGAKARIVTLNKTIDTIEKENTLLRHRHVIAQRSYDSLVNTYREALDERDTATLRLSKVQADNKALRTKVEKATIWAITFGLLLVVTIGTIAGGVFA